MKKYLITGILALGLVMSLSAQKLNSSVATVRLTKTEQISAEQLQKEITTRELALQKAGRLAAGQKLTAVQQREVLNELVVDILLTQAQERDKITASEADIAKILEQQRQQAGSATLDDFKQLVSSRYGISYDEYKKKLTPTIVREKYLRTKKPEINDIPVVTEEEIVSVYNKQESGDFSLPQIIRFYELQINTTRLDDKAKETVRKRFDAMAAEIKAGGRNTFDALVSKMDTEREYTARIGRLAYDNSNTDEYGAEFIQKAMLVKKDTSSGVMVSKKGFHIMWVISNDNKKTLGLDDLIPDLRITVRDRIKLAIAEAKHSQNVAKALTELASELLKEADVKLNEDYWKGK